MTGLRFESYDWRGGREAMLRFGPDTGPVVIAALPLFEEANRTRQFLVTILRALAGHGIGSVLPDLPGTGESAIDTVDASLLQQRAAYAALAQQLGGDCYGIAIRSGALLDVDAQLRSRWQLAPQSGAELVRQLERTRTIETGGSDYAGNRISARMIAALRGAVPHVGDRIRTVRLATDPRAADATYTGTPLWHRAEPGNDVALAEQLAADISQWMASCAG